MTELMQILYDYTVETSFPANLHTSRYQVQKFNADQLDRQLRQALPEDLQPMLNSYQDALYAQQESELEAMFLSALALAKSL